MPDSNDFPLVALRDRNRDNSANFGAASPFAATRRERTSGLERRRKGVRRVCPLDLNVVLPCVQIGRYFGLAGNDIARDFLARRKGSVVRFDLEDMQVGASGEIGHDQGDRPGLGQGKRVDVARVDRTNVLTELTGYRQVQFARVPVRFASRIGRQTGDWMGLERGREFVTGAHALGRRASG